MSNPYQAPTAMLVAEPLIVDGDLTKAVRGFVVTRHFIRVLAMLALVCALIGSVGFFAQATMVTVTPTMMFALAIVGSYGIAGVVLWRLSTPLYALARAPTWANVTLAFRRMTQTWTIGMAGYVLGVTGAVFKDETVGAIKLSYGRATRVPNGFETLSSVTILGSPLNRPERMHNIQAAWQHTWAGVLNSEIGGFYATVSNRLQTDANVTDEQRALGYVGRFVNLEGRQHSSGANLSLLWRIKLVEITANATRYLSTNDGTGEKLPYIPMTMANLIVGVPLWWLHFNVTANYRGAFTKLATDTRRPVDDYVLLGALARFIPPTLPIEARVGVRNAAGRAHYPSSSTDFPNNFPGRGIEAWGDVRYNHIF